MLCLCGQRFLHDGRCAAGGWCPRQCMGDGHWHKALLRLQILSAEELAQYFPHLDLQALEEHVRIQNLRHQERQIARSKGKGESDEHTSKGENKGQSNWGRWRTRAGKGNEGREHWQARSRTRSRTRASNGKGENKGQGDNKGKPKGQAELKGKGEHKGKTNASDDDLVSVGMNPSSAAIAGAEAGTGVEGSVEATTGYMSDSTETSDIPTHVDEEFDLEFESVLNRMGAFYNHLNRSYEMNLAGANAVSNAPSKGKSRGVVEDKNASSSSTTTYFDEGQQMSVFDLCLQTQEFVSLNLQSGHWAVNSFGYDLINPLHQRAIHRIARRTRQFLRWQLEMEYVFQQWLRRAQALHDTEVHKGSGKNDQAHVNSSYRDFRSVDRMFKRHCLRGRRFGNANRVGPQTTPFSNSQASGQRRVRSVATRNVRLRRLCKRLHALPNAVRVEHSSASASSSSMV